MSIGVDCSSFLGTQPASPQQRIGVAPAGAMRWGHTTEVRANPSAISIAPSIATNA
jgi:hypothetical protein